MTALIWISLDWIFTIALFITTAVLVKMNMSIQKKKETIGDITIYPGYLPLVGHAHLATRFTWSGFVDEMVNTRSQNKGTLLIWVGHKLTGYISNPADIENILNRRDALNKGQLFSFFEAHSNGLLITTTPKWNRMRKLANLPLAHKMMIESFENNYQEQSRALCSILAEYKDSAPLDMYPYLSRCCQDITYASHFGVKLDVQHNEHLSATESVSQAVILIFERMMKVWLYPDFIYYRTERGKTLKKCTEHNQSIAKKIIDERRRMVQETENSQEVKVPEKKLMTKLLDVYLQNGLSDKEITNEILDLMLAGFETMSLSQSWMLLLLAMFPEHQEKVYKELEHVFGDDEEITLQRLNQCHYLDMVFKEAVRLFGIPVVVRCLTNDVPTEHCTLPAEAEIIVGMRMVHRDPRYWDHPDKFYPDHFLPDKVAARYRYAFIPFGGGPRKCPAYNYATIVVKFVVASLLREFRFTTKQDFDNLPLDLFFMYKPKDGFLLNFEPRSTKSPVL